MTKGNAIRYYRKFSGADRYIMGFVYKHELYAIAVDEIMPRFMRVEKSSSKKGGHEKLQLRLNNKYMEQLIRKGAEKIGTEDDLLEIPKNKGVSFERMIYRMNNQEPREKDNVRFDKGGDININGVEYQIKLNGAQIVEFRTLNKIQKERERKCLTKARHFDIIKT